MHVGRERRHLQLVQHRLAARRRRRRASLDPREKHDVDAALNRIIRFRCLLNRRGIEAAPVLNLKGRAAPLGQGGCYWQ